LEFIILIYLEKTNVTRETQKKQYETSSKGFGLQVNGKKSTPCLNARLDLEA